MLSTKLFRSLFLCFAGAAAANAQATAQAVEAKLAVLDAAVKSAQSAGDNAWMLVSSALVLMMTGPGLALFYGGLVRKKNVLGTMMQSFILMCLVTVLWAICGYSLAFGEGSSFAGNFQYLFLNNVGSEANADYAATIPQQTFMIYQLMFAIITPALISGAFAERMRFSAMLLFMTIWAFIVYFPMAHMVWGKGGLLNAYLGGKIPTFDFAGGTVVHISAGMSALVAVLIMGKRVGYGRVAMAPHNLPFAVIGAAMLWVGWFGFNAGSALGANGLASSAFMATHTAASMAALGWMIAEWFKSGKPTMLGAASGAVAGLVAITPASGYVTPLSAIVIGLAAGVVCYSACLAKSMFGYDDSLDVVGVHGVGGILGAILTGVFASKAINPAGNDGLIYGNASLVVTQLTAVAVTVVFAAVGTAVILLVLKAVMGLRVTEQEERMGLDLSQHSETAYVFGSGDYDETVGSHSGSSASKTAAQRA